MEEYDDGVLVLKICDRSVLEKGEDAVHGAVYGIIVVLGVVLVVGRGAFDNRLWDSGREFLGTKGGCYFVCLAISAVPS
jgi:hypothetical protein